MQPTSITRLGERSTFVSIPRFIQVGQKPHLDQKLLLAI